MCREKTDTLPVVTRKTTGLFKPRAVPGNALTLQPSKTPYPKDLIPVQTVIQIRLDNITLFGILWSEKNPGLRLLEGGLTIETTILNLPPVLHAHEMKLLTIRFGPEVFLFAISHDDACRLDTATTTL